MKEVKDKMSRLTLAWLWLVFLVVLDILVPWFLLKGAARVGGAFFFWVIWALTAIVSAFFIFFRWREVKL